MSLPIPYENEFVYSVVARYGMYRAFLSPKQLLDDVYRDRKVVATLDLPNHLDDVSNHFSRTGRYSTSELLYKHTLLPLYAPFVPDAIKNKAIKLMSMGGKSGVHVMLGVNASTVQSDSRFRYCPQCAKEALLSSKELFWRREWFFPSLSICSQHGSLRYLDVSNKSQRHAYLPASLLISDDLNRHHIQLKSPNFSLLKRVLEKAMSLLDLPHRTSPTFYQWTMFYKKLARDAGCTKGNNIASGLVFERIQSCFPNAVMAELGILDGIEKDTGWLRSIFRKHRKSFSYLQHLVVWEAFVPDLSIQEVFNCVDRLPKAEVKKQAGAVLAIFEQTPSNDVLMKRRQWTALLDNMGVIEARNKGGAALYAWLYRNDKSWLLALNSQMKRLQKTYENSRVDWKIRDRQFTKQLFRTLYAAEESPPPQRMSRNWFLGKVGSAAMIYSKKEVLPLTWLFLKMYAESVTEYQLRRASEYCAECVLSGKDIRSWQLLRDSGLSDKRITGQTQEVLSLLKYL